MLVLSRFEDEWIEMSNGVRIVVVDVAEGKVRLGIEAPPHVRVDRREVAERRRRLEKAAAVTQRAKPFLVLEQCGLIPRAFAEGFRD